MNLHRLDLLSLSRFSFVVRTASIGRAVELAHLALARLALAHPAVGAAIQRISNLDGNLGAEHFERNSRGVTLTFAGHTLEQHARHLLVDANILASDLSQPAWVEHDLMDIFGEVPSN